ncbi:MAG: hypothetical protein EAZ60_12070 [Oscillatoriales cyanobacterium]|nr:MAG: hypothetical protein EAZ83_16650 [Oscillatoriales cyanobacterium]TAE93530.1 MAG: hypothetical protein EAZ79_27015 [Oscillatoriales cyanobacterium]TAF18429.1 MAG: hypothetical protein EAZ73_17950 [Oscillatoriales cyanobacterium]TAF30975.1 MAG: hypothetical protein EAZ69_20795 [Oscillatoriales cyanobacterium]TAF55735.1 MAG: hypothetical protein EAZ60_12070 [Oscillatoriales cyanobacterium]
MCHIVSERLIAIIFVGSADFSPQQKSGLKSALPTVFLQESGLKSALQTVFLQESGLKSALQTVFAGERTEVRTTNRFCDGNQSEMISVN